jgi:hypothetical protein
MHFAEKHRNQVAVRQTKALYAGGWLLEGKAERAIRWLQERNFHDYEEITTAGEIEFVVRARVLVAQEKFEEESRSWPGA